MFCNNAFMCATKKAFTQKAYAKLWKKVELPSEYSSTII